VSAAEALKLIASERFDLLLCDLALERATSGFEVVEAARHRDPRIACVMLTGYAERPTVERAQRQGISLLFKPIEVQDLLVTIQKLLPRNAGLCHTAERG
jgi:CheY-like chemotaxis protein